LPPVVAGFPARANYTTKIPENGGLAILICHRFRHLASSFAIAAAAVALITMTNKTDMLMLFLSVFFAVLFWRRATLL